MSIPPPLAVSTADAADSIWQDVGEKIFRENVADLQEYSDKTPGDSKVYSRSDWQARVRHPGNPPRTLPFEVEQRLADDLAFVVATQKESTSVSAATLEEEPESRGVMIRIATNDKIKQRTVEKMNMMFRKLEQRARMFLSRTLCREDIFDLVVDLDRICLHGRIQSLHWKLPVHWIGPKIPLETALQSLLKRVHHVDGFDTVAHHFDRLCSALRRVDKCTGNSEMELIALKDVVLQCHVFCTPDGQTIQETLARYGFSPKEIGYSIFKRLNKIGRYYGLCEDLVRAAGKYREIFKVISLRIIPGYLRYMPPSMIPSQGTMTYHVHAEIQILSFYDMHPELDFQKPRVIGVSKAACYLCNLFIINHRQFHITKTHGKLYHMWTFPDLKLYSESQRLEYRNIINTMNAEVMSAIIRERLNKDKRPEPMESYIYLPQNFLTSPLASDAGTITSNTVLGSPVGKPQQTSQPARSDLMALKALSADSRDLLPVHRSREVSVTRASHQPKPASLVSVNSLDPQTLKHTGTLLLGTALEQTTKIADDKSVSAPSATPSPATIVKPTQHSPPSHSSAHPSPPPPRTPSSLSTTLSTTYPNQKQISSILPFHTRTGDLSLTIEIEAPARGTITIDHAQKPEHGYTVDVHSLQVNETREFERADDDEELILNLQHSDGQAAHVKLRWL